MNDAPRIRRLGRADYETVWQDMRSFVASRPADAAAEIWLVEHPPVFTLGQNAAPEHVLAAGDIPVVQVDRGGQVTYHGPGQLVVYPLIHLPRLNLNVRRLVCALENAIVDVCARYGVTAYGKRDAPGVYVNEAKVASIGLRIRNDWCFHGLALNVNMDLSPFARINPCGYKGLEITQLQTLAGQSDLWRVADDFLPLLLTRLGYNTDLGEQTVTAKETA